VSKAINGILDIDGEKISYTFRRTFQMPKSNEWNSTITADYHGSHIVINDHGGGLEYALNLLRQDIMLKRETKKTDSPNALPVRERTKDVGKDAISTDYTEEKE
jgi:hypothetical protein